jgi:hypothetical protein
MHLEKAKIIVTTSNVKNCIQTKIVKGMLAALRSVFVVLCLLMLVTAAATSNKNKNMS